MTIVRLPIRGRRFRLGAYLFSINARHLPHSVAAGRHESFHVVLMKFRT